MKSYFYMVSLIAKAYINIVIASIICRFCLNSMKYIHAVFAL